MKIRLFNLKGQLLEERWFSGDVQLYDTIKHGDTWMEVVQRR